MGAQHGAQCRVSTIQVLCAPLTAVAHTFHVHAPASVVGWNIAAAHVAATARVFFVRRHDLQSDESRDRNRAACESQESNMTVYSTPLSTPPTNAHLLTTQRTPHCPHHNRSQCRLHYAPIASFDPLARRLPLTSPARPARARPPSDLGLCSISSAASSTSSWATPPPPPAPPRRAGFPHPARTSPA